MTKSLYAIGDQLRTITKDKKAEDDARGNFGPRHIWLTPKKGKDSNVSNLRGVWLRNNKFGQDRPLITVFLHEGLDKLIPGTRRRLFPRMEPGTTSVVCLNMNEKDDFCEVCRRLPEIKSARFDAKNAASQSGLQSDKKKEREWGGYWSKIKRTKFHYFVAIKHLGHVAEGSEYKAGKMAVCKDPEKISKINKKGWVTCDKNKAERWADPIGIIKWKDWWFDAFADEMNKREMVQMKYEAKIGHSIDLATYLEECPLKRPDGPFDPVNGFDFEVTVTGRGLDQEWKVAMDEVEPVSLDDKLSILAGYPNMMGEITPVGKEDLPDMETWMGENPGSSTLAYQDMMSRTLSDAQAKHLGLDKEAASPEISMEPESKVPASMEIYSLDGGIDSVPDLGADDDLDIPF